MAGGAMAERWQVVRWPSDGRWCDGRVMEAAQFRNDAESVDLHLLLSAMPLVSMFCPNLCLHQLSACHRPLPGICFGCGEAIRGGWLVTRLEERSQLEKFAEVEWIHHYWSCLMLKSCGGAIYNMIKCRGILAANPLPWAVCLLRQSDPWLSTFTSP